MDKIVLEKFTVALGEDMTSLLVRLVDLGQQKGYVLLDDILDIIPEAEQDVSKLEEVFLALKSAGIPYLEESDLEENEQAPEESEEENTEESQKAANKHKAEDFLASIDVDDTIGLYVKEASQVPLLSAEEEVELAQRMERGLLARQELTRNNASQKRQKELRKLIEDGWAARSHLITANARLVISVAKKYIGRGVPFLDLIQEGNIGLMRAAKKYDYKRGYKFSTYATWWIRQAVTRAVADQGRTIRVPVHMGDKISKLYRTHHQLKQELSRDPTLEELAEALDMPLQKVEETIHVARRPLSLQMPVGEEEDEMLGDFVEDTDAPDPDESAVHILLREHLGEALERLPAREVRILQLRYGLLDGQTYTLREVGDKMGITRERVRQIEAQALRRLRTPAVQRQFRAYIE